MFGTQTLLPPQPLSPVILYRVHTIRSLKVSPSFLSFGDNKVPVPLVIERSFLTIKAALVFDCLLSRDSMKLINKFLFQLGSCEC